MFKLIRDKIPEIIKSTGKICNYATVENTELYTSLLNMKLAEEVNEYLNSSTKETSLEELADVLLVVKTLVKNILEDDSEEAFQKFIDEVFTVKNIKNGTFTKKYIGFFEDPVKK